MLLVLLLCGFSGVAQASHFRGGTFTTATIDSNGVVTATMETSWRKNAGDGTASFNVYAIGDTTRATSLGFIQVPSPRTDSSDPDYDVHTANLAWDLSAIPLAQGTYIIRYSSCCRIGAIANAVSGDFAVETVVNYSGSTNSAPVIFSDPNFRIAIGQPFSQNLNANDPDGDLPLTYVFLTNTTDPEYGAAQVAGLSVDSDGQLSMSGADTGNLNDGDNLVAKIRITDSTGAWSDRDIMFIAANTGNSPPVISDPLPGGNSRTIQVGDSLVINVTATDPDSGQLITLTATGVPANATFVPGSPGNPVSGTFTFNPDNSQQGQVFGINFDAQDDDGTFPLTDSVNLLVGVGTAPTRGGGDPAAESTPIPTLSEWAMIMLVLSLGLYGGYRASRRMET
ncbi:IPTL-CTERM sorting domain-containing protein [Seongchinamella unica]|uniref:IPTL-CTERM sorting domain-containing protein n=1 Tax=Seongchinamella unica TaxID=2547392 RepID=UPI0014045A7B|nr:IPTL-CTERM sorting domain-containing protein [Seongchinamella unica]